MEDIGKLVILHADRYGDLQVQPPAIHVRLDFMSLKRSKSIAGSMYGNETADLLCKIEIGFRGNEESGYMIKTVLLL